MKLIKSLVLFFLILILMTSFTAAEELLKGPGFLGQVLGAELGTKITENKMTGAVVSADIKEPSVKTIRDLKITFPAKTTTKLTPVEKEKKYPQRQCTDFDCYAIVCVNYFKQEFICTSHFQRCKETYDGCRIIYSEPYLPEWECPQCIYEEPEEEYPEDFPENPYESEEDIPLYGEEPAALYTGAGIKNEEEVCCLDKKKSKILIMSAEQCKKVGESYSLKKCENICCSYNGIYSMTPEILCEIRDGKEAAKDKCQGLQEVPVAIVPKNTASDKGIPQKTEPISQKITGPIKLTGKTIREIPKPTAIVTKSSECTVWECIQWTNKGIETNYCWSTKEECEKQRYPNSICRCYS